MHHPYRNEADLALRVLLLAYEYPPILSAQSIRWYYLSRELRRTGIELDVLTVDLAVDRSLALPVPEGIRVERTFAGPFVGSASRLGGGRSATVETQETPIDRGGKRPLAERIYRTTRALLDQLLFPDVRAEWLPFASKKLRVMLDQKDYDCIIASHEPAVDLMLAARARRSRTIPLIADMGDPVATPYSPRWRYRFDRHMEGRILRKFDRIVVTDTRAEEELKQRHDLDAGKFAIIPQGTELEPDVAASQEAEGLMRNMAGQFTILYTGNFYRNFRNPAEIRTALGNLDMVRFVLVGSDGREFEDLENVEVVSKLGHFDCLHLQRSCTVLLSLGNRQAEQTPGKIMEYLGAGRPVLHVYQQHDFGADLVTRLNRGLAVPNRAAEIEKAIRTLHAQFVADSIRGHYNLGADAVAQYSWRRLAESYSTLVENACAARGRNR